VIGRLMTGWLVDRFRGTYVSFVLLLIAAIGLALLAGSHVFGTSVAAILLIGFGVGGELDITPFLISRYFGLRAVSTLYGVAWTAMGVAAAVGPFLMGRAFDRSGTYDGVLAWLAVTTLAAGALMLILPPYNLPTREQRVPAPGAD